MERMREQKNGKRKKKEASFSGTMGGGVDIPYFQTLLYLKNVRRTNL